MQVCPGRFFEAYFPSTNPVAESITEPLERGDEGLEEFGHRAFPSARKTDYEWQRVTSVIVGCTLNTSKHDSGVSFGSIRMGSSQVRNFPVSTDKIDSPEKS